MDPYVTEAGKIPPTDLYYDFPLYGRYNPSPQDFKPLEKYCNSNTQEALQYWTEVLGKCDSTCYVYQNPFGGRDVFALGRIIVKSCHLGSGDVGSESSRDYSIADKNEVAAIQLVPNTIPVPRILFSGKLKGKDVIIQQRIPGVGLNVVCPYLSPRQKSSFKKQTRKILHQLSTVKPPSTVLEPTYIVSDPNPISNRGISSSEYEILFGNRSDKGATQLSFMHNDLQPSNIIVQNDQIVGIVDWEHAGWFHWDDVGAIHSQFRIPRREDFAGVQLSEEELSDLEYWGHLYALDPSDGNKCSD
ncbi:kinase-like domain-containing protein [Trichoderma evansii]